MHLPPTCRQLQQASLPSCSASRTPLLHCLTHPHTLPFLLSLFLQPPYQLPQGEEQKKLDVISNDIFCNCLRMSGRTGVIASEEEATPVAVEETDSGNYIVVFDPLDGSSNIDAGAGVTQLLVIISQVIGCKLWLDACVVFSKCMVRWRVGTPHACGV